jgi:hypothetical protein
LEPSRLCVVAFLPEEVHRPDDVPAPLAQGLDQWAADAVVREETKAGHYRPERLLWWIPRSRSISASTRLPSDMSRSISSGWS